MSFNIKANKGLIEIRWWWWYLIVKTLQCGNCENIKRSLNVEVIPRNPRMSSFSFPNPRPFHFSMRNISSYHLTLWLERSLSKAAETSLDFHANPKQIWKFVCSLWHMQRRRHCDTLKADTHFRDRILNLFSSSKRHYCRRLARQFS